MGDSEDSLPQDALAGDTEQRPSTTSKFDEAVDRQRRVSLISETFSDFEEMHVLRRFAVILTHADLPVVRMSVLDCASVAFILTNAANMGAWTNWLIQNETTAEHIPGTYKVVDLTCSAFFIVEL